MSNDESILVNESQQQDTLNFDRREMLRYNANKLSYALGLLAMSFSVLGAFICLNSMNPITYQVIIIILLNVFVLLGGFLAAEKVKNYVKGGAIAQLVFGSICAARIFYIPLILVVNFHKYIGSMEFVEGEGWVTLEGQDEVQKAAAANLGETIKRSYGKSKYAVSYLPASGYFRGISAMVFFALAAVCFIAAGLIGLKKAKTLNSYMNSIKKE